MLLLFQLDLVSPPFKLFTRLIRILYLLPEHFSISSSLIDAINHITRHGPHRLSNHLIPNHVKLLFIFIYYFKVCLVPPPPPLQTVFPSAGPRRLCTNLTFNFSWNYILYVYLQTHSSAFIPGGDVLQSLRCAALVHFSSWLLGNLKGFSALWKDPHREEREIWCVSLPEGSSLSWNGFSQTVGWSHAGLRQFEIILGLCSRQELNTAHNRRQKCMFCSATSTTAAPLPSSTGRNPWVSICKKPDMTPVPYFNSDLSKQTLMPWNCQDST